MFYGFWFYKSSQSILLATFSACSGFTLDSSLAGPSIFCTISHCFPRNAVAIHSLHCHEVPSNGVSSYILAILIPPKRVQTLLKNFISLVWLLPVSLRVTQATVCLGNIKPWSSFSNPIRFDCQSPGEQNWN